MMTPAQIRSSSRIRQDFLDFFKSKQHTIVPSSSLLPDSPNLLFTNAGMNQFVPIFLGQVKCPYQPGRAADTQKCIRAGGKHNDLEDVGLDTYHHTFFEMLGNWSFGDYFKKEAIDWAWELVVEKWKFPKERLYATIYNPDKSQNDPSERDEEAWNCWSEKFRAAGLDPAVHIVHGGKKDNFWMMGDTGPCGPCSELHVDLTPAGDTKGSLVNQGDARCIEIWNLVFIQFNANPDGTFSPLPARHVDTGMGFERVVSIIQGTKGFKDFAHAKISNYETDIFRPIFDALEKLSGKKYASTLPGSAGILPANANEEETRRQDAGAPSVDRHPSTLNAQQSTDIAFRVIADHIRTLGFAIADGIQPSNEGRGYVLRRILRRAVRYGRTLEFKEPFFYKLVDVLADTMGDVFPEIRTRKKQVQETIQREEEAFNKTLDRGIELFEQECARLGVEKMLNTEAAADAAAIGRGAKSFPTNDREITGDFAFKLYDTYGFPLDLTELMARERGLTVDTAGFEKLMQEQRARARAAQKKEVVSVSQIETTTPTKFVGYENLAVQAKVLEVVNVKAGVGVQASACSPGSLKAGLQLAVILDTSACYAEMGGQLGDTGELEQGSQLWRVTNTQKSGNTWLHFIEETGARPSRSQFGASRTEHSAGATPTEAGATPALPIPGDTVTLSVDRPRREAIQRHHTVTHLLHWALHEVVSKDASQKGSFVGPDKLTFDFNSAPLTPQQVADIEKLVNERILENAGVSWTEVSYADVKSRKDVMQFFGDKYGDTVRVVQIGGHAAGLDGYSMELCGGTHTRATGEIGLFRIVGEGAIAAGVRRIEAVAGLEAYRKATDEVALIKNLAGRVNSPVHELEKKIEALLAHQKELEKQFQAAQQREASNAASRLLEEIITVNGIPAIIHNLGAVNGDFLQSVADALKQSFKGVIVLGGGSEAGSVALVAAVTPDFIWKFQAGKIIQHIAPIVGGKGGGKPDNARGGGKDAGKLDEALATVKTILG
jgi:alanyl-tRNA synthetase